MKNLLVAIVLFIGTSIFAQSPVGTWKTVDDETGKAKSHIQIYEKGGELYGKIVKVLTKGKENAKCTKCDGDKKNKPLVGLIVLEGVEKDGKNKWDDGEILDPTKGKVYDVSLELINENKLKVRGYVGFSLLGRTQYWERVK